MVRSDATTKLLLAAIAVLLAGHVLILTQAGAARPALAAGVPDTGAQFQSMVDELQNANKRLDALQRYLESGNLTVKVKVVEKEAK